MRQPPSVCRQLAGPLAQGGAALLMLLIAIVLSATYAVVSGVSPTSLKLERDNKTNEALAQAKAALIAYAASAGTPTSGRPGDLPCPDRDNDGKAGTTIPLVTSCGNASGSNQSRRLGRLPWKDLGLPELRDASGELLWYAVSNNFKQQTRTAKLNSDTPGTITVRDGRGNILHDGSAATGVVAVIIAPGPPIKRQDGRQQSRTTANLNDPRHYLDNIEKTDDDAPCRIFRDEDNADFNDSSTDGFFAGPVRDANCKEEIANDQIAVITRDELFRAVERRVANEVVFAMLFHFCGMDNVTSNNTCRTFGLGSRNFPSPAQIGNTSCLGTATISANSCPGDPGTSVGRIPAETSPGTDWTTNSILRRFSSSWFQSNGWRELVFYGVAPACTGATVDCNGVGYLTVQQPAPASPLTNRKLVVAVSGRMISVGGTMQNRSSNPAKSLATNYLEGENSTPFNTTFVRSPTALEFNDVVSTLP